MARIAGVDLPKEKRGVIALTYIYGVGVTTARNLLTRVGIDESVKAKDWSDDTITELNRIIGDEMRVEGELRSEKQMNIKRLQDIACYRGIRHRKGLPVRGQKTKTNARTRKGKAVAIAGKKKATK